MNQPMNNAYSEIMMPAELGVLVCLKDSNTHGVGIFAKASIPKNAFIHYTHVYHPRYKNLVNLTPNYKFNHSKTKENCELIMENDKVLGLHSLRAVSEGEELFVDYTKTKLVEEPQENWDL